MLSVRVCMHRVQDQMEEEEEEEGEGPIKWEQQEQRQIERIFRTMGGNRHHCTCPFQLATRHSTGATHYSICRTLQFLALSPFLCQHCKVQLH